MNWKIGRWVCLAVAVLSALFLLGIAQSVLGMTLTDKLIGFETGTLLGIANIIAVYILYKVL